MSTTFYRQCLLRKQSGEGTLEQVCWIPERFAVVGKDLKLREDHWQSGWRVCQAWPTRRREDQLPDPHADIKRHRRQTGDSLSKVKP